MEGEGLGHQEVDRTLGAQRHHVVTGRVLGDHVERLGPDRSGGAHDADSYRKSPITGSWRRGRYTATRRGSHLTSLPEIQAMFSARTK